VLGLAHQDADAVAGDAGPEGRLDRSARLLVGCVGPADHGHGSSLQLDDRDPRPQGRRSVTSLAGGAALDALAEPPLDGLVGRVRHLLDALAEAWLALRLDVGLGADATREVGLELLLRRIGLLIDALGEARIGLLRSSGVLVLDPSSRASAASRASAVGS
jgi:hypothetical protein